MEKTFTYKTLEESVFGKCETGFNYEVKHEELLEAVVDCVYDDFFRCKSELSYNVEFVLSVKKGLKDFIIDTDNLKDLVDKYEYDLKEYFEAEAFEYYKYRG